MIVTHPRERDARSDAKSTAIVNAAREVFLARGFDGASMDEIALTANVSKRTVYNRFASKEELFGAAIEDTCRRVLPIDIDEIALSSPPSEFLKRLGYAVMEGLLRDDAISLRRIAAFEAVRSPAIGRYYMTHGPQKMVERCTPALERLADKGALKFDDAKIALWHLGALISEPLHTQMLMGAPPKNLPLIIERQVDTGVEAFLKIYGVAD